jgi:glutamine amidotransferase-like uncharacterized protein
MMKIAYLTGPYLATSSIRMMLHEQWGADNVYELRSVDLAKADLSRFDMLVLPGSVGEISPYPAILREEELDNLSHALHEGLIVWTDCSATYYMLNDIRYLSSNGEEKTRTGLGLIGGTALGPVEDRAMSPQEEHRFAEVVLRRIAFRDNGNQRLADVCYGNGPGLYLSEEELANPNTQVLARYDGVPQAPVAGVTKKIGHGLLISLGVLVQIAPHHMHGRFADDAAERHRLEMFNHLSRVDDHRISFLKLIINTINSHYKTLNRTSNGGLEHATYP